MDRRKSDFETQDFETHDFDRETADEVRRTDWIIGLLSALVLAIVLYAAAFGLGRNDQIAATKPVQGLFSMTQLDAPMLTPKDKAR